MLRASCQAEALKKCTVFLLKTEINKRVMANSILLTNYCWGFYFALHWSPLSARRLRSPSSLRGVTPPHCWRRPLYLFMFSTGTVLLFGVVPWLQVGIEAPDGSMWMYHRTERDWNTVRYFTGLECLSSIVVRFRTLAFGPNMACSVIIFGPQGLYYITTVCTAILVLHSARNANAANPRADVLACPSGRDVC